MLGYNVLTFDFAAIRRRTMPNSFDHYNPSTLAFRNHPKRTARLTDPSIGRAVIAGNRNIFGPLIVQNMFCHVEVGLPDVAAI